MNVRRNVRGESRYKFELFWGTVHCFGRVAVWEALSLNGAYRIGMVTRQSGCYEDFSVDASAYYSSFLSRPASPLRAFLLGRDTFSFLDGIIKLTKSQVCRLKPLNPA